MPNKLSSPKSRFRPDRETSQVSVSQSTHRAGFIATLLTLTMAVAIVVALSVPYAHARTTLIDPERDVLTVAPVIEMAAPAVVNISVSSKVPGSENPLYRDPFFRRFFGIPDKIPDREVLSAGSGVIVNAEKGHVLTNHHVVENADRITVRLKDGRQFEAKLLGSDPATDIALIEIDAKRLVALPFDRSGDLRVGDFVIAIGNPFGLGQTVTSGIVSALGRSGISRDKFENFIQTDAPINPGNSGGALINTRGELVGINTAIIAPGGGNVGIGFAVPSGMARAVMDQLLVHGEVRRGRIGVSIQDITPEIAEAMDISETEGALISKVEPGSPAEDAGLKAGDAIVAMNGTAIRSSNDLRNRVGLLERGKTVDLGIVRKGARQSLQVKIGEIPVAEIAGDSMIPQLAGARITDIPSDYPATDVVVGAYVADVARDSSAWKLGLRSGDIIESVNRKPVTNLAEFERVANAAKGVLALEILRGDQQLFIVIQ